MENNIDESVCVGRVNRSALAAPNLIPQLTSVLSKKSVEIHPDQAEMAEQMKAVPQDIVSVLEWLARQVLKEDSELDYLEQAFVNCCMYLDGILTIEQHGDDYDVYTVVPPEAAT